MFSLICAWIYAKVNNREAGDLRRHRTHSAVIVINILILDFLYISPVILQGLLLHKWTNFNPNITTSNIKYGMKVLTHSQTTTVEPLKHRNGGIIPYHTLLGMWYLIDAILIRVSYRGPAGFRLSSCSIDFVNTTTAKEWVIYLMGWSNHKCYQQFCNCSQRSHGPYIWMPTALEYIMEQYH